MKRPLWSFLPAELTHSLAPSFFRTTALVLPATPPVSNPFSIWNVHFPNRIGLAGGLDKNAYGLDIWPRLGFGFFEIGTVTPYAQKPNSRPRVMSDWKHRNLWNKLGFPNDGAAVIHRRIKNQLARRKAPLFINVGKNRTTPIDRAAEDYALAAKPFVGLADAFVVNVSSPNTQDLRSLQDAQSLRQILRAVRGVVGANAPLLVKFSPDETDESLKRSLELCLSEGIQGVILTNTTTMRPRGCPFPKEGGLSGRDLRDLSLAKLKAATHILHPKPVDFALISVGGILSAEDIRMRLHLGADLVQIYSALVFKGPLFVRECLKQGEKSPLLLSAKK